MIRNNCRTHGGWIRFILLDAEAKGDERAEAREHAGWFSSGTRLRTPLRIYPFFSVFVHSFRLSYFLDWTVPLLEPSSLIVVASITLFVYGRTYRSINRTDNAPVDPTYRPPQIHMVGSRCKILLPKIDAHLSPYFVELTPIDKYKKINCPFFWINIANSINKILKRFTNFKHVKIKIWRLRKLATQTSGGCQRNRKCSMDQTWRGTCLLADDFVQQLVSSAPKCLNRCYWLLVWPPPKALANSGWCPRVSR